MDALYSILNHYASEPPVSESFIDVFDLKGDPNGIWQVGSSAVDVGGGWNGDGGTGE
jgi:hypothetical protein